MNSYNIIETTSEEIPMVSVAMLTYNHQDYISEAIESVLMQKTSFKVELVIAEDFSPDNTRAIVVDYQKRFPDKIKVILQNENVGARKNNTALLSNLKGKYVAALEGDDYWIDPYKLQKQVDFLENDQSYIMVCTNFDTCLQIAETDTGKQVKLIDILKQNPIGTQTVLFRSELLKAKRPEIFNSNLSMSDYQTWLWMASISKIFKLGDITAHYRILQDSATGRGNYAKKLKFAIDVITVTKYFLKSNAITGKERREVLQERYGYLFHTLLSNRDGRFIKYQIEYFRTVKHISYLDFKILIRGFIILFGK